MNLNRVLLAGRLTRDPELRYLPSNVPVVGIGLAVNRRWRNQQGEQQEETTFVDCEAFGKTAEVINQYLKKGRPIFIDGRLKLDSWEGKDGDKRQKLKVVVESFQFVDTKEPGEGDGGGRRTEADRSPQRQREVMTAGRGVKGNGRPPVGNDNGFGSPIPDEGDEIPFAPAIH